MQIIDSKSKGKSKIGALMKERKQREKIPVGTPLAWTLPENCIANKDPYPDGIELSQKAIFGKPLQEGLPTVMTKKMQDNFIYNFEALINNPRFILKFASREEKEQYLKEKEEKEKKAKEEYLKKKKEELEQRKLNSGIPLKYLSCTLDTLAGDFVEQNKKIVDYLQRGNFERGLYFFGKVGCGKTSLMSCIANKLVEEGENLIFTNYRFLDKLEQDENFFVSLQKAKYLFIDDISKKNISNYFITTLFDIIDYRNNRNLPTFITDNYSMKELFNNWKTFGKVNEKTLWGLYSRMNEEMVQVKIEGNDRRKAMTLDDVLNSR